MKQKKKEPTLLQTICWIVFCISMLLFLFDINWTWSVGGMVVSGVILFLRWITRPITFYIEK